MHLHRACSDTVRSLISNLVKYRKVPCGIFARHNANHLCHCYFTCFHCLASSPVGVPCQLHHLSHTVSEISFDRKCMTSENWCRMGVFCLWMSFGDPLWLKGPHGLVLRYGQKNVDFEIASKIPTSRSGFSFSSSPKFKRVAPQ